MMSLSTPCPASWGPAPGPTMVTTPTGLAGRRAHCVPFTPASGSASSDNLRLDVGRPSRKVGAERPFGRGTRSHAGDQFAALSAAPARLWQGWVVTLRDMLAVTMQPPRATSTTGTPVLVSQRARSPMDAHVAQIEGADV